MISIRTTLVPEYHHLTIFEKTHLRRLPACIGALSAIAGCVVGISHDGWFLERIATHILAFEGDSKITFFLAPCGGERARSTTLAAALTTGAQVAGWAE
jgi:ATPase subunit of ABC transporter with duplicated ATPase domains